MFRNFAANLHLFFLNFVVLFLWAHQHYGQIFSQDFSSSTTVSSYASASPNNGQFNSITTAGSSSTSIASNRLRFTKTASAAGNEIYAVRTTDFCPVPTAVIAKFDVAISSITAANSTTSPIRFMMGNGLTAAANLNTANSYDFVDIITNSTSGGSYAFRHNNSTGIATTFGSAVSAGTTVTVWWIMNNSGVSLAYTNPSGSSQTIANDRADVWVVNSSTSAVITSMLNGTVNDGTRTLVDFKIYFPLGTGTMDIDNISIDYYKSLPTSTVTVNGTTGTNYPVGTNFGSLTRSDGLFAYLNTLGLGNNTTVQVTGDVTNEDGTVALNQWNTSNTLTIQADNSGTLRNIRGNIAGNMLQLNGVDNLTIDGRQFGSSSTGSAVAKRLRITNTSTNTAANTIYLYNNLNACGTTYNGCTNNLLQYCTLENGGQASLYFDDDNGGTGHNNNLISFCDIKNENVGGNTPQFGVYARGTTATHTSNTISNCNIFDFFKPTLSTAAIWLDRGITSWTISNNRIFQTATRTPTSANSHYGIYIYGNTTGTNYTVSNNTLGYTNTAATGTYTFGSTTIDSRYVAIRVYGLSNTGSTTINNNTIANYAFYTSSSANGDQGGMPIGTFCGIAIGEETSTDNGITTVTNNLVGNTTVNADVSPSIYVETSGTAANTNGNTGAGSVVGFFLNSSSTQTLSNSTFAGIQCNSNTASTASVVQPININGTGNKTLTGNTIGSTTQVNNIVAGKSTFTTTAGNYVDGVYINSTGTNTITNNIFANWTAFGTGGGVSGCIYVLTGSNSITNNQIYGLKSQGIGTGYAKVAGSNAGMFGIGGEGLSAGTFQQVNNNLIYDLTATNTSNTISTIGIYMGSGGGVTNEILGNRIYDLKNNSANPNVNIIGIGTNQNGAWNIMGNMISLGKNVTTNTPIYGIRNDNTSGFVRLWCNSIYIEGTQSGNTINSAAFYNTTDNAINVRNNIFFNARTSGAAPASTGQGKHYAIFLQNNGFAEMDYNTFFTTGTQGATVGAKNGTDYTTFASWRALGNDTYSWSGNGDASVSASSLFTNTATADLHINNTSPLAWYVFGKGKPISTTLTTFATWLTNDTYTVSVDLDGNSRSVAINTGPICIGADEFTINHVSNLPPLATESGTRTWGSTTTYTWGNRTLCSINWVSGSTLPSAAVPLRYYSGIQPPAPTVLTQWAYSYWQATPNTFSGNYTIVLQYGPHETGTVNPANTSNCIMAKGNTAWVKYLTTSTPSSVNGWGTNPKTMGLTGGNLTSFSEFTLTNNVVILPVEWLSFAATKQHKTSVLDWATVNEKNNAYFEVQRANANQQFCKIGVINSDKITTTSTSKYSFVDMHPFAGINYYRLKQIDIDGAYSYSKVVAVSFDESNMEWEVLAYPNPTSGSLTLQFSKVLTDAVFVTVYNSIGQKVIEQEIKSRELVTSLPLHHLENGVYLVYCTTQDYTKVIKIVVQK